MKLIEVKTSKEAKEFVKLHTWLYKEERAWIRPLDKDIEDVFNEKVNQNFKNGVCTRWILMDNGMCVGRIAAFIDYRIAYKNGEAPVGGIGFFECINNQEAANMLLDASKEWLKNKGMEAMDGPINFGDRDKWWGLLTKGFELEPNYRCNYHLSYYKDLFENYGFETYFKHYTFIRNTADPLHHRIKYKSDIFSKDKNYHFEHMNLKHIDKYTEDIVHIYNKAWVNHEGVAELSLEQGRAIIAELRPIIDEKIIWFAYFKKAPVAFYINIPEVNQVLKYVNGKLGIIGKLKFVWHQWRKTNNKMLGLVFGVVPEHQGKGLDGALIMAAAQMIQKEYPRYPILEINGIGDFNKKMLMVIKQVGGEVAKEHTTYRYSFNGNIPFQRITNIG
ncbi:hypothetical protein [Flavivirga eckloniae]|uniref:N-acetyltransferase domain-containing protein n=1 Tax=Flavivirga eckloniae TaxID=1803846 RepID=A0A2K9PKH6_9FLAO|nr:hypothetical protein [Flavivirga eckloniae]AUP77535.1 hypothetical protein C1H87_01890 [Flavivirga eckloniae]